MKIRIRVEKLLFQTAYQFRFGGLGISFCRIDETHFGIIGYNKGRNISDYKEIRNRKSFK